MDLLKKRKLDDNGVVSDLSATSRLTIEDSRKLLESFTHEQTLEILQTAVLRHPDVLDQVRSIADRDTTQRKLFVRGLGWETTTDKLRSVFGNFGELEEAVVILDKATGKSKGYGFVTFKHVDGALLALKEPSKQIDGRMAVTQLAAAGMQGGPGGGSSNNPVDVSLRKIYVANVPHEMPAERILQQFAMYGEIEEGPLGFDKVTGKSKGYALFVYKTVEAARASLSDPVKNIDGHQLICKLAIDGKKGKPGQAGPGGAQVQSGGHGGPVGPGMQGGVGGQYGAPGGVTGYGGYQGPSSFGGHAPNSALGSGNGIGVGGPGVSSYGSQTGASSLGAGGGIGSGVGGTYGGGSYFGGPGSAGYGALGGTASGVSTGGLNGAGGALGAAGRGSSLYGLPPSSTGVPSGDYPPQSVNYGHQLQGQHNQAAGASAVPRVTPGGMYQGMHSYY